MKQAKVSAIAVLMVAMTVAPILPSATPTTAQDQQVKTTYVHLANGVPGVFYEPVVSGEKSRIGVFVMHAAGDYLTFSACTELSMRGYRVLCANNSSDKSQTFDPGILDKILTEARLGVAYLRKSPGIEKVVLFGHSGGATVMTSYQDIAENGLKACQGPEKLHKCPDNLAGLPPADGVMLIDANFGQAEMALFSVDPAVASEDNGKTLNPDLDLYNPKNGFNPAGSTFSKDFIRKFQSAEGKRENALIKTALDRMAAIKAGSGRYADDEPFFVPGANSGGGNNKFFAQDIRLLSHTRKAWPLLRPDGTVVTQIVRSVRLPENATPETPSMSRGALKTTVKGFLTSYAIRVTDNYGYDEDTVRGVDWTSTYSSNPGNAEGITVPLVILGMTGHWEYAAAEEIYDHAKSKDKTLAYVEGATHGYSTCTKCEKTPGQFGNTMKTTYDYVDGWLSKKGRF
jgi:hypothetical protein